MTELAETRPSSLAFRNEDDLTYQELLNEQYYSIGGQTLADKSELLGVPHVIQQVTFWYPSKIGDFVSIEGTVADIETLDNAIKRGWIPNVSRIEDLKIEPEEKIVYNDGSTGIRRQLVKMFSAWGMVNPAEGTDDARFDKPWSEWQGWDGQTREQTVDGTEVNVPSFANNHAGGKLRILARRGLYASSYSNEYGDATTYYLR